MIFFIFLEVMFFFHFFGHFFSFNPSIFIGGIWLHIFLLVLNLWVLLLLNTFLLLFLKVTITVSHHFMRLRDRYFICQNLYITIFLVIYFFIYSIIRT